jgi:hypothetical protein
MDFAFGSPFSIRLNTDASARTSPSRIRFVSLLVIRPSYHSEFNRKERKERKDQK